MTSILITGNTYPVKDKLRALGGVWNAREKGWMVPSNRKAEADDIMANAPVKAERSYHRRGYRNYGGYRSNVYNIGGNEYYRNKAGRCEDAPCCGCCTI